MHSYYIDKTSGTSADTLLATGFAQLVRLTLLQLGRAEQAGGIWLIDDGAQYRVELPQAIEPGDLEQLQAFTLIRHLDTEKQAKALGEHYGKGFDYDEQRRIRDAYQEQRKQLPAKARSPKAYLLNDPDLAEFNERVSPPDPLLPIYLMINQMKSGASFNEPILRWHSLPIVHVRRHIQLLLHYFSRSPNDLGQLTQALKELDKSAKLGKPEMTMLQLINPTAGKGSIRSKADGIAVGNPDSVWVLELLKFVGLLELAHPQTIRGSKDRKTYIVHPKRLQLSELKQHIDSFRRVHWSNSPARIDILAVLFFTRVLLIKDRNAMGQESKRLPWQAKPAERFQGFDVSFYKDMGSAYAVMNVATLNIPNWIQAPTSVEHANRMLVVLEEHSDVVESIRSRDGEERTEEYELLRRYRDFISGEHIEDFLDFAALFGPYIGQKADQGLPIKRFSIDSLKELFAMAAQSSYQTIIENPGFQQIASAIRQSTVTLQFKKGRRERVLFDIRYGLAHELVRSANSADNFVATLTQFVASYNNETAQTYETSKGAIRRRRISQEELIDFFALLDQGFSAKTLARMLVAFGSAKVGKDDKNDENAADSSDDAGIGDLVEQTNDSSNDTE